MMDKRQLVADRYQLGHLIGEGGVGKVYKGLDTASGQPVAVKLLRPEIIPDAPDLVERFRREGRILSELDHPNIVKVLATAEEAGQYYIVMEFVAGGSLADRLRQQPRLPLERALAIALELSDALARVHYLNIVHRDIKPSNILLTEAGTPRLTDFGLARARSYPPITTARSVLGTFEYLSPEGCDRQPLDERTDIWSLGVVLFEMLAGERPFEGEGVPGAIVRAILNQPVPNLALYRDDVPPALDVLVHRMLAKNRGARIASARLVGAELEAIGRGAAPPPAGDRLRSQPAQPVPRPESPPGEEATSPGKAFLVTKLYIPPARPNLVSRSRLVERLDAGLRRGCKLSLISAPAGFGKTTLVAEWVCSSPREVAWISLDEADNDPIQLLTYLIAALRQIDGSIGQTLQHVLQSPQVPPIQSLVALLIADISAAATALILVLDDYHAITSAAAHQLVQALLEHQPPEMHLVITTREDPQLPLPRLRARSQMTDLREGDLRFTPDETAAFLNQTMGLHLSAEAVAALEARTEGWIAGLQLTALALQQEEHATPHAQAFIATFRGDNRYIMDYLVAEVLQRQPEAVRDFLRQTAILDQLAAPLCDAVTGRKDSQSLLEKLAGANLFLIALDQRREWYRYYHLFAEVLRSTLSAEEQKVLHQRAMGWYEAHGALPKAIQHALACASASGDVQDAGRLIALAAEETLHTGNFLTLRTWLDALPDEHVRASAELATYKGWTLVLSGDLPLAEDYAGAAGTHLRGPAQGSDLAPDGAPSDIGWGRLLALRSALSLLYRRDYEQAIELAAAALGVLKEDQPRWRVLVLWAMAEAQERGRTIAEAIATLREAQRTGRALGNQFFAAMVEFFLATGLNVHGQRREAVAVCEEAIERYTDESGASSPMAAMVFSQLGWLHYAANRLELARRYVERGIALAEQLTLADYLALSHAISAPILHAQGETGAGLAALQKAHALAQERNVDPRWLMSLEVDILHWAEQGGLSPDDALELVHVEEHLTYGRLLLAQNRLADARRWLARLESFARERGLYRWLMTVTILQALTAEKSGDRAAACDLVARAARIAAPQDYFRAFLDEDPAVIALLPAARHVAPVFVNQLLDYAGIPMPKQPAAAQPLVEPLSERELAVLRLIAAGLSNLEIAQELVIAGGTVKRHINHIYGKLGVQSRTQAIVKARELRLL
jgi:LuxR family maltose regulon positive regulatory protein